ncbi:Kinesin-like protein kif24 [Nowakowskiella sp. JEL0407]|nr:Kinesin-like protein kif24 [Nowakowskiella sp. JEL0407]
MNYPNISRIPAATNIPQYVPSSNIPPPTSTMLPKPTTTQQIPQGIATNSPPRLARTHYNQKGYAADSNQVPEPSYSNSSYLPQIDADFPRFTTQAPQANMQASSLGFQNSVNILESHISYNTNQHDYDDTYENNNGGVDQSFNDQNNNQRRYNKPKKRASEPVMPSPPTNNFSHMVLNANTTANSTVNRPKLNAYGIPVDKIDDKPKTKAVTSSLMDKIRVCVRKRPLNKKELKKNESDVAMVGGRRTITILEHKMKVDLTKFVEQHVFNFDEVIDCEATNEEVYERTAKPLVSHIFSGGRSTCFAYGQTGSGKTHTMLDPSNGLYVLAANDIFLLLATNPYKHLSAWVSFFEIYQGALFDLLGERKKVYARDDGNGNVVVKNLKEIRVSDVAGLLKVFEEGNCARSTGITGANSDSSRSHAILQICLKDVKPGKSSNKVLGKFSFIDLAGSERGADRGDADQKTRMEGSEINKSLLALKECIRALDQDSKHTPFRQSKLTQVLKDSFVGNSRTCMIATVSPNMSNSEHTLNTLRYADRVKELKSTGESDSDEDAQDEPREPTQDEEDYYNEYYYSDDQDQLEEPFSDTEMSPPFAVEGAADLLDEELPDSLLMHDEPDEYDSLVSPNMERKGHHKSSSSTRTPKQSHQSLPPRLHPHQQLQQQQVSMQLPHDPMQRLLEAHRAHAKEMSEIGREETRLLGKYTMMQDMQVDHEYKEEVRELLMRRERAISILRSELGI